MFEVALLDLDNTLIHNPDRQFAMAFMQCMDAYFQQELQINGVSSAFRKGIQQASTQVNQKTITDVMVTMIAEETTIAPNQIRKVYENFYINAYASLQSHTSSVASAIPLIELLLSHNIAIVIATNPLYPEIAIKQRIEWAGLDKFIDSFKLITNSDILHVSKPNPAYYTDILHRLDLKSEQCIMVGDSLRNDIEPAEIVGIETYIIPTPDALTQFYEHVQQLLQK